MQSRLSLKGRDVDWQKLLVQAAEAVDCVSVNATDPFIYSLYLGYDGHILKASCVTTAAMPSLFMWSHEVISTISTRVMSSGLRRMWVGWSGIRILSMPRYCSGCTTVLYEGKPVGTPDAGAFLARD